MRAKPIESDYQRALLARVGRAFPDHRFFRRNIGLMTIAAKDGGGRMFRAGIKGQSDLYVVGRGGTIGEVELKRYGKLSPEQEHWRSWCRSWGVPWILLEARRGEHPTETVERWLRELGEWIAESARTAGSASEEEPRIART